jgi:hypothetical protein
MNKMQMKQNAKWGPSESLGRFSLLEMFLSTR